MKRLFTLAPAALLLACATSSHAALTCPNASGPCTIDLSTVTVTFGQGLSSFHAEAESDSWYAEAPSAMPPLNEVDTTGRAGFAFNPGVESHGMGTGSSSGWMSGQFDFTDLVFTAKAGYKIDSIEFNVAGYRSTSGVASLSLELPAAPTFSGDNFTSAALLNGNTTAFHAGFVGDVAYSIDDYGNAYDYGVADVAFSSASIVAHVSAVPEPETVALLLAGLPLLAVARRRSRRG